MKKIILDVDTGVDDAQAILLALKCPELEVEAITTVCGNSPIERTGVNTLNVLELAGVEDVPVARGMHRFLIREYDIPDRYIHGEDGLGHQFLPPPTLSFDPLHAVDLLIERVMSEPGEITLVPVGPLTNVAMAILKEPKIVKAVKEVVLMGGAFGITPWGHGNVTSASEFNMWADPEAARIVYNSGLDITAVGIDVAENPSALVREEHLREFDERNPLDNFIIRMNRWWMNMGSSGVSALYDPMAIAVTVDESLVKTENYYVDVVTMGPDDAVDRGQTIADKRPSWRVGRKPNVKVCTDVDGKRFLNFFISRLSSKGG